MNDKSVVQHPQDSGLLHVALLRDHAIWPRLRVPITRQNFLLPHCHVYPSTQLTWQLRSLMNQSLIVTIQVLMRSPQTETRCQTFFTLAGIQTCQILLLSTISGF